MEHSEKKKRKGLLEGYSKIERRRLLFVAALLAFPIAQFLVFYVYINIDSFILSFTDQWGKPSLHFIKKALDAFSGSGPNTLWKSLGRSVTQWSINMFLNFPITILFTYALFKHVKGEMLFRVVFYLPGIIGSVVFAVVYKTLLGTNPQGIPGPVIEILLKTGILKDTNQIATDGFLFARSTAFASVNVFGVWLAIGGNIVILTGAMTRIPTEIFESAAIEGVSAMREFVQIVLPLIWPTLSTLVIYQLGALTTFDFGTYLLYNDTGTTYPVQTMGYCLFLKTLLVSKDRMEPNEPAALGFILTVVTVPTVLLLRWAIEKFTDKVEF